ncbi:hypothetical protein A2V54_00310 [candidate division WWE3 bacterium RBG_19FT_COMBO_53_11]|uniref:Uncharacterized protein n=1 Tax=candidate division WWE3 bacterium RBG_19FT_COMBO_53_11 TaxID=1802613 RepID=A0A1F4UHQ2_UNCKA|nr:MAG: hypothetical protein A2155_00915 [candidate division WWE3 bacterium RBG_16_52_45]OGC44449.1 MAG: hypothetical protein A2V54_00310 [candidate division WWE3 bacterium RBG_19FT_COMBO_53_11]
MAPLIFLVLIVIALTAGGQPSAAPTPEQSIATGNLIFTFLVIFFVVMVLFWLGLEIHAWIENRKLEKEG